MKAGDCLVAQAAFTAGKTTNVTPSAAVAETSLAAALPAWATQQIRYLTHIVFSLEL